MQKRLIGRTGLMTTELIFGTLTISPLQTALPLEEGKRLLFRALEMGINHVDGAESYRVEELLGKAVREYPEDFLLSYKSAAETYEGMQKSLQRILRATGKEAVDIFYLHAAKDESVFAKREGALRCLSDERQKGRVRAVGIATHSVPIVVEAARRPEIDVVFALINRTGLGLVGGSVDDMLVALSEVEAQDKGIVAMKALGGGNLLSDVRSSLKFVRGIPGMAGVAIGMRNEAELAANVKLFRGENVDDKELAALVLDKDLFISSICAGCGLCAEICPNDALRVAGGRAVVDREKCLLCGYCNPVCPQFALRIV